MELDHLLDGIDVIETQGDPAGVDVDDVVFDSRRVGPGALFCCVPGAITDGHDHAPAAVRAGAVALLCERGLDLGVPEVRVVSVREAMARVAARFHGEPSHHMTVVGVTGTNGKTTVTHMLRSILESAGRATEVIGTLSGARTTPESPDLQAKLAEFRRRSVRAVAMEVSSHALDQHRVDATFFRAGVFTNLSHDHLDYHGTMERYFAAKAALFEPDRVGVAVVNRSDPWGRSLLQRLEGAGAPEAVSFSSADAEHVEVSLTRSRFTWRGERLEVPLGGQVNVMNALAAATTAVALGIDTGPVVSGLASVPPVPGRMEVVDAGQPFDLIVDYAHTPDGLERLLAAGRAARPSGRVGVVFGCGGERDAAKRPLMGEVAARLADLVVVTNDNPRHEDPLAIIDQVRSGVDAANGSAERVIEPDRRAAITRAVAWAGPGDVVVVAGKGHETGQQIGDEILPFDDRVVAREAIEAAAGARS